MTWHVCVLDNDYEICDEFPYPIRRIGSDRIVGEHDSHGYARCSMNGHKYLKHRVIAQQFIPNPDQLPCVDHINHDRSDNHLINLRWCTSRENNLNRSSNCGVEYEFYDELPEDAIDVTDYGNHRFEFYYYSESEDSFYYYTGINYRKLHVNIHSQTGAAYIKIIDTNNKRVALYINRFKRLYDLQF